MPQTAATRAPSLRLLSRPLSCMCPARTDSSCPPPLSALIRTRLQPRSAPRRIIRRTSLIHPAPQVSSDGEVTLMGAAAAGGASRVDLNRSLGADGAGRLAGVLSEAGRPLLTKMDIRCRAALPPSLFLSLSFSPPILRL